MDDSRTKATRTRIYFTTHGSGAVLVLRLRDVVRGEWFLAGYLWMDDLSVAYDYGNILDGDKPACLDSTWPVRTCRAAQFVLFIICLDLLWLSRTRTRDESAG